MQVLHYAEGRYSLVPVSTGKRIAERRHQEHRERVKAIEG
jgi:hypothetical protein